MAKIYSSPEEIKIPELNWKDIDAWKKDEERYYNEMKSFCLNYNDKTKDEFIGEIVKFPVADGYAEYMVLTIKPLALVHLPLADAYQFQYVQNLKAKDVKTKIIGEKKFNDYLETLKV